MFLALDPELVVVGEATNWQEAVAQARQVKPDVVLMDLIMRVMDGIAATEIIRRELPDVEALALTSLLASKKIRTLFATHPFLPRMDGDTVPLYAHL